jgi:hypothetical protein
MVDYSLIDNPSPSVYFLSKDATLVRKWFDLSEVGKMLPSLAGFIRGITNGLVFYFPWEW